MASSTDDEMLDQHFTSSILRFLSCQTYSNDGMSLSLNPSLEGLSEAAKYRLIAPLIASSSDQNSLMDKLCDSSFDAFFLLYPANTQFSPLTPNGSYSFLAAIYLAARHNVDHDLTTEDKVDPLGIDFQGFLTTLVETAEDPLKSYVTRILKGARGKIEESPELISYTIDFLRLNVVISAPNKDGSLTPVRIPGHVDQHEVAFVYSDICSPLVSMLTIYPEHSLNAQSPSHYVIAPPKFTDEQVSLLFEGLALTFSQKLATLSVPVYPVFPLVSLRTT